jgi:excisionase family DNA binding protein
MTKILAEPLAVPIPEAAAILGIGRSTFYQLLNAKEIDRIKIGRRSVVTLASLKKYLASKIGEAA